ncbi:MAG: hypothetical protein HW414_1277, partial [Dehalococcoidia bacterium]|nr:hypothetical protein [Dehalococcoidia bacterium]
MQPSKESQVGKLIKELNLRGVVTTNYDRVLDSYLPSNVWRLTNSLEKLKQVSTAVGSRYPFLLKLHGDIDDGLDPSDRLVAQGGPFMVLSKTDYAVLVQGDRRDALTFALLSILQDYSVLFLGYSFSDPDIIQMLHFLTQNCQFPHMSWYIGLKDELLPALPENVSGIRELGTWGELPVWLFNLSQAVAKSERQQKKEPRLEVHPAKAMSNEERRAFLAVGQYLTDLESTNMAERVLASALLEDISNQTEFSPEWLSGKVAKLAEVGPAFADALANATAGYLRQLKLVEPLPDGRMRTVKGAVETLQRRASAEWKNDRDRFYSSIVRRLGMSGAPTPREFTLKLDAVLHDLCVNFGQSMAEWVHRGIGRELGWQHAKELIEAHFEDPEDKRRA